MIEVVLMSGTFIVIFFFIHYHYCRQPEKMGNEKG